MGQIFFHVNILWVQNFSSWVFLGSEIFSCEHFLGPRVNAYKKGFGRTKF